MRALLCPAALSRPPRNIGKQHTETHSRKGSRAFMRMFHSRKSLKREEKRPSSFLLSIFRNGIVPRGRNASSFNLIEHLFCISCHFFILSSPFHTFPSRLLQVRSFPKFECALLKSSRYLFPHWYSFLRVYPRQRMRSHLRVRSVHLA